jgi:hypothetical protein
VAFGARTRGLPVTDAFLVTEHGWRAQSSGVAGLSPRLPTPRLGDAPRTTGLHRAGWLGTLST